MSAPRPLRPSERNAAPPSDRVLDGTPALLRDGYRFASDRAARLGAPVFRTRLGLKRAIVVMGADAAELFYDESRVRRAEAAPFILKSTLFGLGGVQGLDDEEHRHRKAMLMSLMSTESIDRLARLSEEQWDAYASRWETAGRVVLLDEVSELICRAVSEWCGIRLQESEVQRRTRDLVDVVEGLGKLDARQFHAHLAKFRSQRWAEGLIRDVRATLPEAVAPGEVRMPLHTVSYHRDLDGRLLSEHDAAVELLNLLRPTVAVARWVVFLAVALHTHTGARERLASGAWKPEWFIEETRRFYPFFPAIVGRTRAAFDWHGWRFPAGRRLLLDVFGTNRDPSRWDEPHRFRPERFRDREVTPFEFIPQGGGDYLEGHRCAGERATLALMRVAFDFLVHRLMYDVPPQDLRIDLARMPAQPESGFIVMNVRRQ